jgi:hypothetical protein
MPSKLGACAATAIAIMTVLPACDRGQATRGASAGSATTEAPAASSSAGHANGIASNDEPVFREATKSERWPEPAPDAGREFTAGIVEHKPAPRGVALLTGVRAARHDGFDRIVFEFGSGSPPGYHLEYIDKPVRKCGSGDATAIAGDGWLEVRIEPAYAHTPSGAPTIRDRDQQLDLGVVKELEQTCDFEAVVSWVVGVKRPNRYRVLTLNEPLRLVVDVKH